MKNEQGTELQTTRRMRRVRSALALAAAIFLTATASATPYYADFHEYDLVCKAEGYELYSRYPVTRQFGGGAGRVVVSERETLYLGKNCEAHLKAFGVGEWCWGNGGFFATFPGHRMEFSGQELWCDPEPEYLFNCVCRRESAKR